MGLEMAVRDMDRSDEEDTDDESQTLLKGTVLTDDYGADNSLYVRTSSCSD